MRRMAVVLPVALAILASCTGTQAPPHHSRFEGEGLIRGTLLLGDQELQEGWVEMVVWRASEDQCGFPNDCGLSVDALRSGQYWNPGRWIVIPPPVKGWLEPLPFDIVVQADRLTIFEAKYRRAAKSDPEWEEGLFGRQEADFPIGLGFVFENIWRQVIDGKYIAVYAGSHADPESFEGSSDGVVLVTVIDPETWGHKFVLLEAPIPGPIRIMSVEDHRLTMVAPSGERAVFDADARQFV